MAVGAGYPETGSSNVSALHWDMVCDLRDGGEIYADGELIYCGGRFVPEFSPDLTPPAEYGPRASPRLASHAIRATRSMNGRSWTRSTRTPAAGCDGDHCGRPLEVRLGQPERLRGHLLVRAGQQQRIAQPGQPVEGAQAGQVGGGRLAEAEAGVEQDRVAPDAGRLGGGGALEQ